MLLNTLGVNEVGQTEIQTDTGNIESLELQRIRLLLKR